MRRARATMARFSPRRRATCAAHLPSHLERPRCIMTVAAGHNARRWLTSPPLVMPSETSCATDWFLDGVRPTHGPTFLMR